MRALLAIGMALVAMIAQGAGASPPAELDRLVQRAMATFETPGVAIAVVEGNQVVVARAYGVTRQGATTPATARTMFPIGSNTKAMTAGLLATLVDEGRLSWDDRVEDILPGFRMADPYVSREMRVRDLLVHRSGLGLGQGDLLFWPQTDFSRAEIVTRIGRLPLRTSFRSAYAYDNVLYIVAGEVAAAKGGDQWEALLQQRIFAPLGMVRSVASLHGLRPGDVRVDLHARTGEPVTGAGPMQPLSEPANFANAAAAGAVWSTAEDMGRWLVSVLASAAGDKSARTPALWSTTQARAMWSDHTPMPIPAETDALAASQPQFMAYGLGWVLRDWRGRRIALHTGAVTGGVSIVAAIPSERVAFAILTNAEERGVTRGLAFHLLDHYLAAASPDWIAALRAQQQAELAAAALRAGERSKAIPAQGGPHRPLQAYAGGYEDSWYGAVTIEHRKDGLHITFPRTAGMHGPLIHDRHETFRTRWVNRAIEDAFVTFQLNADGDVIGARVEAVSPTADFSFDYQDLNLVRLP